MSTREVAPQVRIYRHPLPVRIWHWITASAVLGLLFTGFNILNIHPRLYWGEVGNASTQAWLGLDPGLQLPGHAPQGAVLTLGSHHWDVSGFAGVPLDLGADGMYFLIAATPESWHFGGMRAFHFAFAWLLGSGWVLYGIYLITAGRLRETLLPSRSQLRTGAVVADLRDHLMLRRPAGAAARGYNLLQKLTYLLILFVVIPLVILTGFTMSNAITARFPELYDLFGGRQSARTLHALAATTIFAFLIIHILQAFVGGIVNELRSMITGYFVVPRGDRP